MQTFIDLDEESEESEENEERGSTQPKDDGFLTSGNTKRPRLVIKTTLQQSPTNRASNRRKGRKKKTSRPNASRLAKQAHLSEKKSSDIGELRRRGRKRKAEPEQLGEYENMDMRHQMMRSEEHTSELQSQ